MSSDMLREVSESLFEYLNEAFPTNKSYTRNDIEQDPMPPLLAHFLGQTLQHRLDVEVEHLRTVRSSWFDYEHPDVQHAYKAFVAALAQYSHIPSEEWRSTLKRATKLVIAHLILPTHTLVEFVFREEDGPLPAPVIYREISYFAAYPYLREAVETFLKKRQLKEIDRTRFSSLLTQVDRHMTANYTVDQWMRMLRPLFDLMRRVPQTRNQGVPIDMLAMFFGDKEAYEIQGRLQVEKEVHRINTIDEEGLRRVIEGSVGPFEQELKAADTPKPAAAEKPTGEARPSATMSYHSKEDAPPPKAPAAPAPPEPAKPVEEESKPLWARFQKKSTSDTEEADSKTATTQPDPDDSVPLWMRFQKSGVSAAEQLQEDAAKDGAAKDGVKDHAPPHEAAKEEQPPQVPEPAVPTSEQEPSAPHSDREPAPSLADNGHFTPPQPEPVATFENPYAPPPSSPYASQDTPPVFRDTPQYVAPQPEMGDPGLAASDAISEATQPGLAPEGLEHDATMPVSPAEEFFQPSIPQPEEPVPQVSPLEALEQTVLGGFGANNRDMFVEHLFSGSVSAYENLLSHLNNLNNWDEAQGLIAEEVFKRYQVNIYSPAAILFTESIEEQFRTN